MSEDVIGVMKLRPNSSDAADVVFLDPRSEEAHGMCAVMLNLMWGEDFHKETWPVRFDPNWSRS